MKISKIYFDLDGVLADFNKGVKDVCGIDLESEKFSKSIDDRMWKCIKDFNGFYDSLDVIPGSVELFQKVYSVHGDNCEILTGVPKASRGILSAPKDKERWVKRNLGENVKVNCVYREDKPYFCEGADCILIDDKKSNVDEWILAGGIGILFTSAEDVTRELEQLGVI